MILFSDYVKDKATLEIDINNMLFEFFDTYPVTLQEVSVNFAPSFGDIPLKIDGVEIIVK